MRPALFVALLLAAVLACTEPDTKVMPAVVNWMEWPAEVRSATPFSVRLVGYGPECGIRVFQFRVPVTIDNSAVTFEPYFLVGERISYYCLGGARTSAPVQGDAGFVGGPYLYDTLTSVPSLAALFPRTYEMRAAASVRARSDQSAFNSGLPIRAFGDVTVRLDSASSARTNAAGLASLFRDTLDCQRVTPFAVYSRPDGRYVSARSYPVDNPVADTSIVLQVFARGYLHQAAAPVCGEQWVFHLVSVN